MKKSIDRKWLFFTIVAVLLLLASCTECVVGTGKNLADIYEGDIKRSHSVLAVALVPTLFSVVAFFRKSKTWCTIGFVLLVLQALAVSYADTIYTIADSVFANIGSVVLEYHIRDTAATVITLCWSIVVFALVLVSEWFGKPEEEKVPTGGAKALTVVLSVVFILCCLSAALIGAILWLHLTESVDFGISFRDMLFGAVVFTITVVALILAFFSSVKKIMRSGSKKHMCYLLFYILLSALLLSAYKEIVVTIIKWLFDAIQT